MRNMLFILAALLASTALAQVDKPSIAWLDIEAVTPADGDYLIFRAGFEITGPPHRWYSVFFELREHQTVKLLAQDKQTWVSQWGQIFTPENIKTARYGDVRLAVPLKDIAAAIQLPPNKRTVLWLNCNLYDMDLETFLGDGQAPQTALIVSTDPTTSAIVKVELFRTLPQSPVRNDPARKVKAQKARLTTKALKLGPQAAAYQVEGRYLLANLNHQASLDSPGRGAFFEPIDSPDKAQELAVLAFAGREVLTDAQQYKALAETLRKADPDARIWKIEQEIERFGIVAQEEPLLGYRVKFPIISPELPGIEEVEVRVSRRGALGLSRRPLITPISRQPTTQPTTSPASLVETFRQALDAAVPSPRPTVPTLIETTGESLEIPRPLASQ